MVFSASNMNFLNLLGPGLIGLLYIIYAQEINYTLLSLILLSQILAMKILGWKGNFNKPKSWIKTDYILVIFTILLTLFYLILPAIESPNYGIYQMSTSQFIFVNSILILVISYWIIMMSNLAYLVLNRLKTISSRK